MQYNHIVNTSGEKYFVHIFRMDDNCLFFNCITDEGVSSTLTKTITFRMKITIDFNILHPVKSVVSCQTWGGGSPTPAPRPTRGGGAPQTKVPFREKKRLFQGPHVLHLVPSPNAITKAFNVI